MTCLSVACTCLLAAPCARGADKESCGALASDWILVSTNTTDGPQLQKKLLQHLRAELSAHGILVCVAPTGDVRAPLASVRIEQSGSRKVGIEVRVDDAITHKVVTRQLDLTGLPPDTHAMTIALGVAELLRASWAEVNLRSSSDSKKPVPVGVRHALEADTNRSPAAFGMRIAGEEFSRHLRQGGVDATFALELSDRWHVGVRLGARQALSVQSSDGRVRAHGWMAGLTSGVRLTPKEAGAHLWVLGRVDAARVQFVADANAGVDANSGAGSGVMAGLGIAGTVALSAMLNIVLEADAGGVIQGVRARDAGQEVMAMDGAWLSASTGISVPLW